MRTIPPPTKSTSIEPSQRSVGALRRALAAVGFGKRQKWSTTANPRHSSNPTAFPFPNVPQQYFQQAEATRKNRRLGSDK